MEYLQPLPNDRARVAVNQCPACTVSERLNLPRSMVHHVHFPGFRGLMRVIRSARVDMQRSPLCLAYTHR